MATTRTRFPAARFCAFCGVGNHGLCTGRAGATGDGECECGARRHDPTVEVAAAMRIYQAPDLRDLAPEVLATQYRRSER